MRDSEGGTSHYLVLSRIDLWKKWAWKKRKELKKKWKKVELQDHRAGRLEVIQSNGVENHKK